MRTADQTVPSASFTAPPVSTTNSHELVLALVSTDGPRTGGQSIDGVSGGGLAFTRVTRANTAWGDAEIWQANATAPLDNAVITASLHDTGYTGSITIMTLTGAAPTVGATAAAGANTGAPGATVTTTGAGSIVVGVGHDWSQAAIATPVTGQVLDNLFLDKLIHDSSWVQQTGPIAARGSLVSIADTTPTADRWNLAVAEITAG